MTHSEDGGVYTITLEKYSYIKNIHIYNRLDCCSDRFLNAAIKVDNNDILKIPQYYQHSSIISFNINTFGQTVIITPADANTALNFMEIKIFGVEIGWSLKDFR